MKICFLAAANSPHSYRWIKYFIGQGHQVCWVSLMPSAWELPEVEFYDIGPLSANPARIIRQSIEFRKIIKKTNPDLLHIHSVGTYGLIGTLSRFHPVVVTAWGSDVIIARQSPWKRPLLKHILNQSDLITCDANHMVKAMLELGISAGKIKVIYFGVEPDKFSPGPKNGNLLREWGAGDAPVIISLRSLEPIYDLETLINAIPPVLGKIPNAKFIIAGYGSHEDHLKKLAESLHLTSQARFIGKYSHDELPGILNSADIYVSTSLADAGIAASTAEAMACGRPVIITDSGENRDWIQDGRNGLLIGVKNPAQLAERILLLLTHEPLRKSLGTNARETIIDRNNYYNEMGKMEKLYREMTGAKA